MKKTRKITKTVLSLTLAAALVLGAVPANVRAEVDTHGYRYGSGIGTIATNPELEKYNDEEQSGAVSSLEKAQLASDASECATAAVVAAGKAEAAVEAAQTALDNATLAKASEEAQITAIESQKDAAEKAEDQEETALEAAEQAVSDAEAAEKKDEELVSDHNKAVNDYNNKVDKDQTAVDSAVGKLEEKVAASKQDLETQKTTIEDLQDEVKKAAIEALSYINEEDDEARIAAAEKAVELAALAATAVSSANSDLKAAQKAQKNAVDEYNKYAKMYGLPLYGETEVTYIITDAVEDKKDEFSQYHAEEKLNAEAKTISELNLDEFEAAVETAKTNYNTAAQNLETAKQVAETAKETLDSFKNTVDTEADAAIKAAGEALEEAANADKDKAAAIESAEETLNYSIEKAQKAFDDTSKALDSAKLEQEKAQSAYDKAEKLYNEASWFEKFFDVDGVCTKKEDAEDALNAAKDTVAKLSTETSEKADILSATKSAKEEYLKEARTADDTAKEAIKKAIKDEMQGYMDGINQVQFDRDLNDWANGFLNDYRIFTKGDIRRDMSDFYDESLWGKVVNYLAITQILRGTKELEDKMDIAMAAYSESLRIAEEKLSERIASFAEADAEKIDTTETKDAADKAKTDAEETKTLAQSLQEDAEGTLDELKALGKDYTSRIAAAQESVKAAEDKLEAIKKTVVELKNIDMSKLLAAINEANAQVEAAKTVVANAKTAKTTIDRYAQIAKAYAEYAKENPDYSASMATAFNQKTDEGLVYGKNFFDYDLKDEDVKSRGTSKFTQVSEYKKLVVPETVYQKFGKAIIEKTIKDANGNGVTIDSMFYFLVDDQGMLTGEHFNSDDTNIPEGTYFVGYVCKQEGDISNVGYHIDGYMVTVEEVINPVPEDEKDDDDNNENTPTVVPGEPTVTPGQEDGEPTVTPGQEEKNPTNTPSDLGDLPTVVDPSLIANDDVIDVIPEEIPAGAVEEPEEIIELEDTVEVPAGQPEEVIDFTEDTEVPAGAVEEPAEDIEVVLPEVPAGDALPQTGTTPVEVFYGIGAGCIALGAVALLFRRKFN